MDFENVEFKPDYHGIVDYGSRLNDDIGGDLSFYAPNTLLKQDGRKILFGWIPGFKKKQGWHGAISLPRELSIDSKGRLIQKPVTELEILRGELKSYSNIHIGKNPENISIDLADYCERAITSENRVKLNSGKRTPEFLSTHQSSKSRIENIKKWIPPRKLIFWIPLTIDPLIKKIMKV